MAQITKTIEEILGAPIEREPVIPGTRENEAHKVRYVSYDALKIPAESYRDVLSQVSPPIPKSGGVILEIYRLTTPVGTSYYALYFHGDIVGWQSQIETGASRLGYLTGRIDGNTFMLSSGDAYPLSDCTVLFE